MAIPKKGGKPGKAKMARPFPFSDILRAGSVSPQTSLGKKPRKVPRTGKKNG